MRVASDPRDLVRAVVLDDYRPTGDSIAILKEKRSGKDAAFAVAFEDRTGVQRRGIIGLCKHHEGSWRSSGGFMGSARATGDRDVWMTSGGWGPAHSPERAVFGGWVADPDAVSARVIDINGRILDDTVENGVVLFMWKREFAVRHARIELLDAEQQVIRTGPMHRGRVA